MLRLRNLLPLCVLSLFAHGVRANDSAMGGHGGSLVPVTETRVVMVSEDIELTYDAGDWDVTAHYVFRNETDEPVKVRMGFPETHCDLEVECVMAEGDMFQNMRTLVRGEEVPRKKGKLSEEHEWAPKLGMVWLYDVKFEPHETLEIDHTYRTPSGADVMGNRFTTYVTRTGALWGKPIERATFRVVLPARTRELHEPASIPRVNAERAEAGLGPLVLTYEARNWTPEGDFHIGFNQRVDWLGFTPEGPLSDLRCEALFSLYLVAEADDGRAGEGLELPTDPKTLRICRNAIYAQHGRRFKDEALNQYFYGAEGFAPDGPAVLAFDPNPDYRDSMLSREDRKVLAMIVAHERELAQAAERDEAQRESEEATASDAEEVAAQAAAPNPQAQTEAPPAPGGCGGCSARTGAGGAAWGWLTLILIAAGLQRRRPCG